MRFMALERTVLMVPRHTDPDPAGRETCVCRVSKPHICGSLQFVVAPSAKDESMPVPVV